MKSKVLVLFLLGFAILPGALNAQSGLSTLEVKNVNAVADTTVNATLPPAPPTFNLSGAITGTATFFISVTAQTTDGLSVFSGQIDPATNTYLVKVPAGTYRLSVSYIGSFSAGASVSTFNDPAPVQVSADTVHDIKIVATVTHLVSGTISALDSRFSSATLLFEPTDSTSGFTMSPARLNNGAGTYTVQLSDGAFSALLVFSTADASRGTIVSLGSVTVAGSDLSADFTTPALANLSGTVQTADMSAIPMGSTVVGIEGNPFLSRNVTGFGFSSFGSGSVDSGTGSYQVVLVDGRTYTLAAILSALPENLPQSSGDFLLLLSNSVQMAGDTNQDIALPQIPATVTISGQVTDSTGAPVANATITAGSVEVTGISAGSFSRSTQADSNGNYQLVVLSGTNYDMMFTPTLAVSPDQLQSNGAAVDINLKHAMHWQAAVRQTSGSAARYPR